MRGFQTLLFIVFVAFTAAGQQGKAFPTARGISLDEKPVVLPAKNGKFSVIAIAFHRSAEEDLKKWLNPLFDAFIKTGETSGTFDMAEIHDVNFAFIPLISGFKRVADDFKSKTDREFWAYIIDTEKTDVKLLQKSLDVDDNKVPYFYVLNEKGIIVERQSGKFSETKLQKLEDAVQ